MGVEVPSNPINRKEQYLAKIAGYAVEIPEEPLTREEAYLDKIAKNGSGGGGGTSNYEDLKNKPQIAGTTLSGNKSLADLGIASAQSVSNITNGESINNFAGVETALSGKQAILTFDDTPTDGSNNPVKSNGIYDSLAGKQNATDNNLDTDAKTIVGAINEHEGDIDSLKSGLTNLDNEVNGDATTYPYAPVITVEDAVPANLADCSVKVEPVQDLHGYDKPWVGGAGKNKLPFTKAEVKAANSGATWTGNKTTINGVEYEILEDDAGNTIGIKANGTATTNSSLRLKYNFDFEDGVDYILNGCPSGGSNSTYRIAYSNNVNFAYTDFGSGVTIRHFDSTQYPSTILSIAVFEGTAVNNIIFTPMIRLSTETDATFAPYTNICPISGHTEAVVTRDGKNWFDGVKYLEGQYYQNGTKYVNANYDVYKYVLPVGNYVVKHIDSTTGLTNMVLCIDTYDSNGNILNYYQTNYNSGNPAIVSFSVDAETAYVYISVRKSAEQVQLEVGTQPTPYEPYSGQQYTLALGDTYYKGLLDVDTGVFTSYNVKRVLNDPDKWVSTSGNIVYKYNEEFTDRKQFTLDSYAGLFTSFIQVDPTDRFSGRWQASDSNYFGVRDDDTKLSLDTLKASATARDLSICYELATPFTVQLTPQQIQLLQGQNTLYASTGDISVSVNGVSGAIGQVQEQVNELAGKIGENQIYSDTPVQIGTVGDKPLYRLFVTFETPISSVDNAYTSTGINSEDIELILRGDGINADGTYYGHLAFDPTFNDHQAIGVKGVANIKYAVIEYI